MKSPGYSANQILLHWAVALLVLFNYFYSDGMGDALDAMLDGGAAEKPDLNPAIHVWVGGTVLVLVILRLILRYVTGAPGAAGAGMMQVVATWGHRGLYLLAFLAPLAGAVAWFGGVEDAGDLHQILANLLILAAGGHAAIALWHHFMLRDGLLSRMFRPGGRG